MTSKELKKACKELAKESFEWIKIRTDLRKEGKEISDEELQRLTEKGAWNKYLKAGGDRSMINMQMLVEDDFGAQYHILCKEAGIEP